MPGRHITRLSFREVCELAVDVFGKRAQMDMVNEECSELIQAVCKRLRGVENRDNIIEEIADVELMLEQLKYMEDISPQKIEEAKEKKIERLKDKLSKVGVED